MISDIQIKAARSLLKMSQLELAELAGITVKTIGRLEGDGDAIKKANMETILKIKTVLENRGIKFLYPKEKGSISGIGVRLILNNIDED